MRADEIEILVKTIKTLEEVDRQQSKGIIDVGVTHQELCEMTYYLYQDIRNLNIELRSNNGFRNT